MQIFFHTVLCTYISQRTEDENFTNYNSEKPPQNFKTAIPRLQTLKTFCKGYQIVITMVGHFWPKKSHFLTPNWSTLWKHFIACAFILHIAIPHQFSLQYLLSFSVPLLSSSCNKLITVVACLQAVVCVLKREIQRGENLVAMLNGWKIWEKWQSEGEKTEKFANHSADPRGLLTLNILRGSSAGKPLECSLLPYHKYLSPNKFFICSKWWWQTKHSCDSQSMDYPDEPPKWTSLKWTNSEYFVFG